MRLIAALVIALAIPAYVLAGPSIVGSMQAWDPADPAYDLALNGNGIYELTKTLVAGAYDYKAVDGDAWGLDFPGGNQSFTLGADGDVTWYVNLGATVGVKEGDEFVFHSMNPPIVAGDMQSELGGADWDAGDPVNTVMSDPDMDGIWTLTAVVAPEGDYQCKVVLNNNWDQSTGDNVSFHSDGVNPVTFTYDMSNNTTGVSTQVVTQQDVVVTFSVCLPAPVDRPVFDVCVTGNHGELTDWGDGMGMSRWCPDVSPNFYMVDVTFYAGSDPYVEYKYKKDSCQTWESTGNHSFTIDDSSPTQVLPLDGWEFTTPDCPNCTSPVEDASWGTIKSIYR